MAIGKNSTPIRISLSYVIFGFLWILLSDRALELFTAPASPAHLWIQTAKGGLFVLISASLIYFILKIDIKSLVNSEERYRALFNSSLDAVMLTSPSGEILSVNPAGCRMLERTEEEIKRIGRSGIVDTSDPRLALALEERERTGKFEGVLTFIRKNGEKFPADVSSSIFKDKDGNLRTNSTLRDITERKRTEDLLRESEKKLQDVFTIMEEGMALNEFIFDEAGEIVDYRILEVNPAFERIAMLTREQVVGQKATEIYQMSSEYIHDFWEKNLGTSQSIQTEYYVAEINKWRRISTSHPLNNKFATVFLDTTEQKMTELALRESEANLIRSQQTAHIGNWIWDTRKNVVTWSDEMKSIFGLDPETYHGDMSEVISNSIHPDDRERVIKMNESVIQDGTPASTEYRVIWKDGSIRHVWAEPGDTVRDEKGNVIQLSGIVQDITERKQAEETLRNSETNLRAIWENNTQSYMLIDPDRRVRKMNHVAIEQEQEIFGRVTQPGDSIYDIVRPQERDWFDQTFEKVLAGEMIQFERDFYKGEVQHWYEYRLSPVRTDNGENLGVFLVTSDITERKQAETELQKSELRYRTLVENSPFCIHEIDLDGRLISMNPSGLRMMCVKNESEIRFMPYLDAVSEEDRARIGNLLELAIQGQSSEFEYKAANGSIFQSSFVPVKNSNDQVTLVTGLTQDITERKQTEAAFRTQTERLNLATRSAHIGIWDWDIQNDKLEWDDQMFNLYGINLEQSPHAYEAWLNGIHPDDREYSDEVSQQAVRNEIEYDTEFRVIWPDGSMHWLKADGQVFRDPNGKAIRMVGLNYDITERKLAEENIREKDIQFRKLSANMPDLIFQFTRRPDGTYHVPVASEGIRNIFGCTPEDVAEDFAPIARVIHPEDSERVINDIEFSAKHLTFFTCEFRVQLPGREGIQWIFSRSTPEKLPDGRITWYGFNTNITERKLAEVALQSSEQNLAEAQRLAHIGSWEWDMLLNTVSWSKEMFRVFDVDPETFEGKPEFLLTLVHPDDIGKITKSINDNLEDGSSPTMEYRIIHRDGSIHHVLADGKVKFDEAGKPIKSIGTVQDITERKQVEEARRASELRFRAISENSLAGVYTVQNGKLSYVNPALADIFKFDSPELIGADPLILIHPDDRALVSENIRRRMAGEIESLRYEFRGLCKNGEIKYIEVLGARVDLEGQPAIIGNIVDITERKQAEKLIHQYADELEKRVQERTAEVHDLYNNAPAGYHSLNAQGMIVQINETELNWLGYTREELVGVKSFRDLFTPQSKKYFAEQFPIFLKQGWIKDMEFDVIRKDGSILPILVNATAVYDESGTFVMSRSSLFDITKRKQAEIELQAANIELEKASKLKDEFLANMSHELRTPLNSIMGFSEILLEGVRGPINENQKQAVQMIRASGEHLLGLINDILDVSRIEAGKFELHAEIIQVNEICQKSLNFIKQLANKKSITVEYASSPPAALLSADPIRLKQILVNLLNNAVKFTSQKGTVKLQVQADAQVGLMHFSVIDTGVGIAPSDLDRLFQPFVQLDSSLSRQHEGSGLGLSLVKKMVELHGGSVEVQSEVNEGSRFTFSLPWNPSQDNDQQALLDGEGSTLTKSEKTSRFGKILIADDNEVNVMMLRDYLENIGHQVFVAHHGGEVLPKTEEVHPDIILMDLQMPHVNGFEATRRIKTDPRFASVPIIALTAFAMSGDRERCLEAGMDEYISKPFKLKEIDEMIGRFLAT